MLESGKPDSLGDRDSVSTNCSNTQAGGVSMIVFTTTVVIIAGVVIILVVAVEKRKKKRIGINLKS